MLIFNCTECKEQIICTDDEGPDQVYDRVGEHIDKCAEATFTFKGTTDVARDRAVLIRSGIKHDHIGKQRLHSTTEKAS
jgi:hypothetical protein